MAKQTTKTPDEIMEMIKNLPTSEQVIILKNLKEILENKQKEFETGLKLIHNSKK